MNVAATIKQFITFCKAHRIEKSIVLGIPYVGNSLAELIFSGETQKAIQVVASESSV